MTMNDPVRIVAEEMQDGTDVLTALEHSAAKYPNLFPALKVEQAKILLGVRDPQRLNMIVGNMAMERGVTIESVIRGLGIQIPSNK